jgi:3-oxoacid CoA-transferase B subunit
MIAMQHTTKDGKPKIVYKCNYPITARKVVKMIFTDLAVIEVNEDGLLLREVAPGFTAEDIQAVTEPKLKLSADLKEIDV